jgi:hypothetical protein
MKNKNEELYIERGSSIPNTALVGRKVGMVRRTLLFLYFLFSYLRIDNKYERE